MMRGYSREALKAAGGGERCERNRKVAAEERGHRGRDEGGARERKGDREQEEGGEKVSTRERERLRERMS